MKPLRKSLCFLGSVYFALIILAAMCLIVMIGTFTESSSGSHRYAALYTYDNPLFTATLAAMFLNILLASLKRWPFHLRHIPFLITHLGLLMVIGGVIVKNLFGLQGNMRLIEGGSSNKVLLPSTQVIRVEAIGDEEKRTLLSRDYPIESSILQKKRWIAEGEGNDMGDLSLQIAAYSPHSEEEWLSWIKEGSCTIQGLAPFPLYRMKGDERALPIASKVILNPYSEEVWDLYAVECDDVEAAIKNLLLAGTTLVSAKEEVDYSLDASIAIGDEAPYRAEMSLVVEKEGKKHSFLLDLSSETLLAKKELYLDGEAIRVATVPKLAFLRNIDNETFLVAIDNMCNLFLARYPTKAITPLIVYNEGFGGYYASATLPFPLYPYDPKTVALAKEQKVVRELRRASYETSDLSPPLKALAEACEREEADFPFTLYEIYKNSLSDGLSRILQSIDWLSLPEESAKASIYSALLAGSDSSTIGAQPPFLSEKMALNRQLLAIADELPPMDFSKKLDPQTALQAIKAALDLYRIDLSFFTPNLTNEETKSSLIEFLQSQIAEERLAKIIPPLKMLPFAQKCALAEKVKSSHSDVAELMGESSAADLLPISPLPIDSELLHKALAKEQITLETPIVPKQTPLPPIKKLEEEIAKITLFTSDGKNKQFLSLSYDPTGETIAWPALAGKYRFRFQPKSVEIDTTVWLHDARVINYPGSSQTMSYEATIAVREEKNGEEQLFTMSMNRVYESKKGVRFYLSNISPSDETSAKRVDLVVNYDPAKYILTYPGALIVAIGTLLLFFCRFLFPKK